jgi:hypothetical protein
MHHYVDGEDTTWAVDGISDPLAHCDTRWTWAGCSPIYSTPPDHREVMQQALDALERGRPQIRGALVQQDQDAAITALRAALGERND